MFLKRLPFLKDLPFSKVAVVRRQQGKNGKEAREEKPGKVKDEKK